MDDCIIISDDEDVQLIKHVVNLEPIIIDLTEPPCSQEPSSQRRQQHQQDLLPQPSQQHQDISSQQPQQQQQQDPASQQEPNPPSPPREEPSWTSGEAASTPPRWQSSPPPPLRRTPSPTPPHKQPSPVQQIPSPVQQIPSPIQQIPPPVQQIPSPTPPQPAQLEEQSTSTQKPVKSDHELMMAQKALGNEKYKNNLFDDAIRIYKRANELAKKLENKEMSAILHFNLAMTYCRVGSYDQAADECANAVKINDHYIKAHLKRAEIYLRQCKFEEAVICYEHICEIDKNNQDYAILLNTAREASKKEGAKKKDYYKLLGLDSLNFSRDDLKKAYRQKALNHHPDRHSDADIVTRKIQEKRFKEASEAHTYISLRLGFR